MNQAEVYEGGAVRLSPMRQKEANLVRYIKNVHNYFWPVGWGSEPITRLILELMNEIEHFPLEERSDLLSDIISRMKSVSGESTSHSSEVSGLNNIIVRTLKSLLLAVKAEIELIEEVKKHKCFGGFDYNQLWRLVIDGEHQQKHGKYTFEGEEGYLAGVFQGLCHMLKHVRVRRVVDAESLIGFHDSVIGDETEKSDFNAAPASEKGLHPNTFGFMEADEENSSNYTDEGMSEIRRQAEEKTSYQWLLSEYAYHAWDCCHCFPIRHRDPSDEPPHDKEHLSDKKYTTEYYVIRESFSSSSPKSQFDCLGALRRDLKLLKEDIDQVLGQCEKSLSSTQATNEDKELAIAQCIATIDRMHPFRDGNIRTSAVLLCNALRISQGLSPVIWRDPNCIDGFSYRQIVMEMQAGAATFQKYKRTSEASF
ncbi:MAG: Fic family protein [Endozoicomonas sp.]|uniref:Fic family protein n=1 Tax=Endozoicomonas sp. TaxID=1892382 RepID=UPI003D9AC844